MRDDDVDACLECGFWQVKRKYDVSSLVGTDLNRFFFKLSIYSYV